MWDVQAIIPAVHVVLVKALALIALAAILAAPANAASFMVEPPAGYSLHDVQTVPGLTLDAVQYGNRTATLITTANAGVLGYKLRDANGTVQVHFGHSQATYDANRLLASLVAEGNTTRRHLAIVGQELAALEANVTALNARLSTIAGQVAALTTVQGAAASIHYKDLDADDGAEITIGLEFVDRGAYEVCFLDGGRQAVHPFRVDLEPTVREHDIAEVVKRRGNR